MVFSILFIYLFIYFCTSLLYFILIWKKDIFSTVMLKWVLGPSVRPSNWNMVQKSGTVRNTLGHDQEAFRCHKTVRPGRDSKTHNRMNSYALEVKELIPWWCKEWLICWWPHVGIFQPPLKTPEGLVFFFLIYNFFLSKCNTKTFRIDPAF